MSDGIITRTRKGKKVYAARVYYTDANGNERQREKSARTLTHARALRDQMRRDLQDVGVRAVEASRISFKELADEFEEKKLIDPVYVEQVRISGMRTAKRQKSFLKPLRSFFENSQVRRITYEDLLEYRKWRFDTPSARGGKRAGRRSVSQVNRELSLLRAILNYARRVGIIARSPFDQGDGIISLAQERKRDRILTPQEETRLLAQCTGRRRHLGTLIIMALDTGMRKSEMLGLKWSEVNFKAGYIMAESFKGVSPSVRPIGMTARLREALEIQKDYSETDFVFDGWGDIKKAWTNALAAANKDKSLPAIEDLRFHDLRHTATTRMVQAGIAPTLIMSITGHTQFSTFKRYVNSDEGIAQSAAAALEKYNQTREKNREPGEEGEDVARVK